MRRLVLWLGIVAVVLLEGCMWDRVKMNDPDIFARARYVIPGKTTTDSLAGILKAQPTRKRQVGDKVVYEYSYADSKTELFTLVVVTFSCTENITETLYVETDAQTGIVTSVPKLSHHEPEWRFWPFDD